MTSEGYVVVQKGAKRGAGEWHRVPFQEVVYFQEGPGIRHWQYRDKGVPFVNIRCLVDGRLDVSSMNRLDSIEVNEKYKHFLLDAGDYVVSSSGTIGRIAEVSEDDIPCMLNTSVIRMRSKDESLLNRRYLRYFLTSSLFQEQIHAVAAGSVQVNYGPTHLNQMWMALPPMPQQRAIAHVLGTLDDKIELNRRMNETLEAMARALFNSWFVDFEPVRAKMEGRWRRGESLPGLPAEHYDLFPDRLVDSALGEIPEGWEVKTLGDVAEQRRSSVKPEQIYRDTPYIALEHMPKKCIALSEWGVADGLASGKFRFEQGDILFGKLRPYFHKAGVAPLDGVCSTDIVVVQPKPHLWSGFVLGHISSTEFVEYTDATSTGTRMPRTNWVDMARYKVTLPSIEVSNAFTGLVYPCVNRIVSAIHEAHCLAAQRDALLPRLVSAEMKADV